MLRLSGYLLDTNHLFAYFAQDAKFVARLEAATPDRRILWTSAISLGEVEAGYRSTNHDTEVAERFRAFLTIEFLQKPNGLNFVLPVDEHARHHYADIVGRILSNHPRRNPKQRTEDLLNQQGVDINDVWIFATAWTHNLTLLTRDKMAAIRDVVSREEVAVDSWL